MAEQSVFDQFDGAATPSVPISSIQPVIAAPRDTPSPLRETEVWRMMNNDEKRERGLPFEQNFQINNAGKIETVPEGGMTEGQSKAQGFYQRMRSSETQMKRLNMGPQEWSTLIQQRAAPTFSRANLSDKQLTQLDLMENWISASLRLESGAAIGQNEFDKQARIFFPQPGAGPEEQSSKLAQRELAILGFGSTSGRQGKMLADESLIALGFLDENGNSLNSEGKPFAPDQAPSEQGSAEIQVAEGGTYSTDADFKARQDSIDAWSATQGKPFDQALIEFNATMQAKGYGEAGADTIEALQWYEENVPGDRGAAQWRLPITGTKEEGGPGLLSAIGSGALSGYTAGLGEEIVQQFDPDAAAKLEAARQYGQENYPGTTLVSEIASGVLSPINKLTKIPGAGAPIEEVIKQGVKQGAIYGGAYGGGDYAPDVGLVERIPGVIGGTVAGATGGYVGGKYVTPAVTSAVEKYVAPVVSRLITPSAAQAIPAAEAAAIPLITSDIVKPRTWFGRWTQETLEKIPVIGTGGARSAQREAREAAITKLYDDFNAGTAEIDDITGDFLKVRGEQIGKLTREKGDVINKVSGSPVDVTDTITVIDSGIAKYGNLESYQPLIAKLQSFRNDLLSGDMRKIELTRKAIGDALGDDTLKPVSTELKKIVRDIYPALREDMGRHIKQFGEAGDFAKWRSANAALSDFATDLENATIKRVLAKGNATPEEAKSLLFSKKPSEVRALFGSLSEEGKKNARALIVQDMVERAGGIDSISPARFITQLKNSGKKIGVVFEPTEVARLDGLLRALQFTRRADQAAVTTPTGQALLPVLATGGAAYLSPAAGVAGTVLSTIMASARIYETKAVKNLLISLSRTAPGSKAEQNVLGSLAKVLSQEAGREGGEAASETMARPTVPTS